MFLHANSEDSNQTGRMPRLIEVLAGRTGPFVGFVMHRLKFLDQIYAYCKTLQTGTLELFTYEPQHDKINKMSVRPAKTQISLAIHPV